MLADNDTLSIADAPSGNWLKPNTVSGTLIVAVALCLICSFLVSGTAVLLRSRIEANKLLKKQRNVLIAAGLFDPTDNTDRDIPGLFENVEPVLINLPGRDGAGGLLADDAEAGRINQDLTVDTYDPRKAAKDPRENVAIPAELDQAGIRRRERVAVIYLVRADDGSVDKIVLPVYGKGLWSTLYGFLALDADPSGGFPVTGITFYEQAETPGLGGEVDNPKWKAQWPGKTILSDAGTPTLDVTKPGKARAENQVDGLSGATITSNGVEHLVNYWLGKDGFGPFLNHLKNGELDFSR